jgi:hypothetical protein
MTRKLLAAVAGPVLALIFPCLAQAAPSDRLDKVDFAKFTCAQAIKLKQSDAERYGDVAQWLAGWLAEPKAALDVSFPAIARAGDEWATACAARPEAKLKDVAKRLNEKKNVIALSALKCQEFLELDAADPKASMGLIRWLDGYYASALRETTANFYYHKKHMASATDGCMKYPRGVLAKVVAGKYR